MRCDDGAERGAAVSGRRDPVGSIRLSNAGFLCAAGIAGDVPCPIRVVLLASVALLTLLLGPDKEAAALYLFLGYYPLLQPKLDAIRRPALRWMAKLALAVVSVGTMYLVLLYVLGLTQVTEEFADTAPWLLWITAALGLVVFIVYDILLRRFAILWRRRRKR